MTFQKKSRVSLIFSAVFALSLIHGDAFAWENPAFSVVKFGGTANDVPQSIVSDSSGNTYVGGYFAGTTDFNPSSAVDSATSQGLADAFIAKYSPTGDLVWARYFGGTQDDQVIAMATDNSNNLYVTGTFQATVDFDTTSNVETVTANGSGTDVFVSKFSLDGNRVWTKTFGASNSNESSISIATDSNGNLLVGGTFNGTVDFDPGAGSTTATATGGYTDIFILKLNSSGEFIWLRNLTNSQSSDDLNGLATFPNGDVVAVGGFGANSISADFDPGIGTYNLSAGSINHNIFIWKLTADGSFGWAKNIGNSLTADRAYSVAVDGNSNVYTTGTFQSVANFSPAGDTLTATSYDAFVIKHNGSGGFEWVKQIPGSGADYGRSIKTDSASNVFITGHFNGNLDLDLGTPQNLVTTTGARDVFVYKLNSNGDQQWSKSFGSTGEDPFMTSTVDPNGNFITSGYTSAAVTLTSGTSVLNLSHIGAVDGLYVCLNSSGNFRCGIAEISSSQSVSELQRQAREKREQEIKLARNQVSSDLVSGKPLTKENLHLADFAGVTDDNISLINDEIEVLSKTQDVNLEKLTKIVKKYEVVGKIASGQNSEIFPKDLIAVGLLPEDSEHKTVLTLAVKKLPNSAKASFESIKLALDAEITKLKARSARLAAVLARKP